MIAPPLRLCSRHGDGNWGMLSLVVLTEADRLANSWEQCERQDNSGDFAVVAHSCCISRQACLMARF